MDATGISCVEKTTFRVQSLGQAAATKNKDQFANLFGIWGAHDHAIYVVGSEGKAIFFDGKSWVNQETSTQTTLTSVWGTSSSSVWAAGFLGTVLHYNGTTWQNVSPPDALYASNDGGIPNNDAGQLKKSNFWGCWATGTPPNEVVYVVGDKGTIFANAQGAWSKIPSGIQEDLMGVWGVNASQVFIVGDFGTILTGSNTLTKQQTGTSKPLRAVWGRNEKDVYAVGLMGTILHYNGAAWALIDGAPKQALRGIWGPPQDPTMTYLVGWEGTLLRMSGGPAFASGAAFTSFPCVTSKRLEGIWGTSGTGSSSSQPEVAVSKDSSTGSLLSASNTIFACGVSGTILVGP